MISICTVLISGMEDYLKVFLDSISLNCRFVSEVIIVKIDENEDRLIQSWIHNGLNVNLYSGKLFSDQIPFDNHFAQMVCGHAIGMHKAINYSNQEYIWMCDPDIFFLTSVDSFFLELIASNNLDIIGVSHFNYLEQSYGKFPCAISLMLKRNYLPNSQWLVNELFVQSGMRISDNCSLLYPTNGLYLIPGPLRNHYKKFPNSNGIFDMGCNLWLWNEKNKGKWLSFYLGKESEDFRNNSGTTELEYPMNYSTEFYTSNFNFNFKGNNFDLLYHRTRGSKGDGRNYVELYHSLYPTRNIKSNKSILQTKKTVINQKFRKIIKKLGF